SLYTWTKGIAAGAYLVPLLLVLFGLMSADNPLWLWVAPVLAGVFLAITGGLLIWDLEHPERFLLIFTRPQWRSWLVRGAFIIAGYSLVLALHFLSSVMGSRNIQRWLILPGLPLAVLTSIYTAYLFAQAKARDMWQNPLLPPHLLIQSLLLGAASLLPFAAALAPQLFFALLWTLGVASILHLLIVWGETTLTHPTAHARLAVHEMTKGRYSAFFWLSLALALLAGFAPWLALLMNFDLLIGLMASLSALVGLLLYEHAYVQAGQSVPLA
ncbi:MAG TPA: NrfD/PsrC family molybdoenzyme membrane anchor subunit, partial [Pyrinomonadaceae bacterium]|nr:NrfD/PsrC family molybdoenzyme membrane anchor subunit [Pyrinomonadaceae bacterium]